MPLVIAPATHQPVLCPGQRLELPEIRDLRLFVQSQVAITADAKFLRSISPCAGDIEVQTIFGLRMKDEVEHG
ncbi:hypothetical protein D3C85_1792990 [compost metagenome]